MPMDRSKYPANWDEISRAIRERAGWRCEFCGIPNGSAATKSGKPVILTVAHLDHDTTNSDPANLRALCQACHLGYDLTHHMRNAAETRRRKRMDAGQIEMGVAE